jgi:hypothetical protein
VNGAFMKKTGFYNLEAARVAIVFAKTVLYNPHCANKKGGIVSMSPFGLN